MGVRRGGRKGRAGGRGDVEEEIVMVAVSEYRGVSANGLLSLVVLPHFLHGIVRSYDTHVSSSSSNAEVLYGLFSINSFL